MSGCKNKMKSQFKFDKYPNPQKIRENWISLDGFWNYSQDNPDTTHFPVEGIHHSIIKVPFCPESKMSGINCTNDYIKECWYSKEFTIPDDWLHKNVLLNFGAVYYKCNIWVNGKFIYQHTGGHVPFSISLKDVLQKKNLVVVQVISDVLSGQQPLGKQSKNLSPSGCFYTRTTGIWQSVWLELVPDTYIKNFEINASYLNESLDIKIIPSENSKQQLSSKITVKDSLGKVVSECSQETQVPFEFKLHIEDIEPWSMENPYLYSLEIELESETGTDTIHSYFGFRDIELKNGQFLLNGSVIKLNFILDQGYFPDSILTPPDAKAIENDILVAKKMGFNGARLHQRVPDPRTLYYADKHGYLVWREFPDWGLDFSNFDSLVAMLPEWIQSIKRDRSHPSVIAWCPVNECNKNRDERILSALYSITKIIDPSRPVITVSGYVHSKATDIFDFHYYEQDPQTYAQSIERLRNLDIGDILPNFNPVLGDLPKVTYEGQALMISEWGGCYLANDLTNNKSQEHQSCVSTSWGYGDAPTSINEWHQRTKEIMSSISNIDKIIGHCYTQLTDVEQEKNGLLTADRILKMPVSIIRDAFTAEQKSEKSEETK